ncbi:transcriptional regulator, IclR family [Afipia carboxidovorans OM5]|nr:IclR family transcriptional regulator [Afipia carboxidovorans]ACI94603.1 transcriptional regulator, IclR family [Afipia carboxidovorans OM5]BEV46129.1 IclR family transcriptional regulator BlcR [Afipia carboxidovorans]
MTTQTKPPVKKDLAPALTRGLGILTFIARTGRSVTLTEIADELGIAKSSAHGLLATLVNGGFLDRQADSTYRLGLRVVELANARIESSELPAEFYAIWNRYPQFHQEAAILAVLDGPDVIYIACRNSPLALGITFRPGMKLPACCTATGKALLSTLSNSEVRDFYKRHEFARLTQSSVPNVSKLIRQLEEIRERGFSIDDGETRDHMWSVGAPICGWEGQRSAAAVAISCLRSEVTPDKIVRTSDFTKDFARALSEAGSALQS